MTYHAPAMRTPQVSDMRTMNTELGLGCTEQELQEMTDMMVETTKCYQRISEMTDTSMPRVKYPRTPGYKPSPEDNPYNAWAWRCDIAGAPAGKISGKTIAIKDNTAVAGVPMSNGSKLLQYYVPEFDATVVTRILEAGGRIVGKSAADDMCFAGTGLMSRDGPVRNPSDQRFISGGSSSGSAALVAGGEVDMATGGDQGGSIRIPASFTGICGLKPSWGLVPCTGSLPVEPSVDHIGPMARSVHDCALLLEVMAGYDEGRDSRQCPHITVPLYTSLLDEGVRGKKIGLLAEGFELCSDETVNAVVREAGRRLTEAGVTVQDISVPMHKDGRHLYMATVGLGSIKCTVDNQGAPIFHKGQHFPSLQEAVRRGLSAHTSDMQPLMKFACLHKQYVDTLYGNRFYSKGANLVQELNRRYDEALQEVDVLILPTLPCGRASKIPQKSCSFSDLMRQAGSVNANTQPFNCTGHPAMSVNAGFSPPDPDQGQGRLPIGMMIVGKKMDEVTVLQVARAHEKLMEGL